MKPRIWIVVVWLSLACAAGGIYLGKRSFEKSPTVARRLAHNISPLFGGSFSIQQVRIGLFSVYLSGVKVVIPLQSFSLAIQDIKIGFSFFKLLKTNGDIGRSISTIIFVKPIFTVSLQEHYHSFSGDGQSFSLAGLPVRNILISDCAVRLIDKKGKNLTLVEHLRGKLSNEEKSIAFELKGRVASIRQNLSISGIIAPGQKKQHVSLRINKARPEKEFQWDTWTIGAGMIDGVLEIAISDSISSTAIDAQGYMTIEEGTVIVPSFNDTIKQIDCRIDFSGNKVRIDTVAARWRNASITGKAISGFFPEQKASFYLRIDGIDTNTVTQRFVPALKGHLSGNTWIEVRGEKRENQRQCFTLVKIGGARVFGMPIQSMRGVGSFTSQGALIDSVSFVFPDVTGVLRGEISFQKHPRAYYFKTDIAVNRLETLASGVSGSFTLHGEIAAHGGNEPVFAGHAQCHTLIYHGMNFGSPDILLSYKNTSLFLNTITADEKYPVLVDGVIDNIGTDDPRIHCDITAKNNSILAILTLPAVDSSGFIDSIDATAQITRTVRQPLILLRLACKGKKWSGDVDLRLDKKMNADFLLWQLESNRIHMADTVFPLRADGTVRHDTLFIRSFSACGYFSGNGHVETSKDGSMALDVNCEELPLKRLNRIVSAHAMVFDSGTVTGKITVSGRINNPAAAAQLQVTGCALGGIPSLSSDITAFYSGNRVTVHPFTIRRNNKGILSVDAISLGDTMVVSGTINHVPINNLIPPAVFGGTVVKGFVSGTFRSSDSGFPIKIRAQTDECIINDISIDSVKTEMTLSKNGCSIDWISACDSTRTRLTGHGMIPWSALTKEKNKKDTVSLSCHITGDLLATMEHAYPMCVGGTGYGEIHLDASISAGVWSFRKSTVTIPRGVITVTPFVPDDIKEIVLKGDIDKKGRLHFTLQGKIGKRPVLFSSLHEIPPGFEPIQLGPVSCGLIQARTPAHGVDIYMAGYMEDKTKADIEFGARKPFNAFTMSGPIQKFRITGTWIMHNARFTFPAIDYDNEVEDDPFPYITWDMDLKPGNKQLVFFYNVGGKKRRLIRFVECVVDPSSVLGLRGREKDGTFQLVGGLRSYRGTVFYGRDFGRNFEFGVDFSAQKLPVGGYDNTPIVWGSAEAVSDTSRFEMIKLTLLVRDSLTGTLREKGRYDKISFKVSSDFEKSPGETERAFLHEAGLEFTTLKGAGEMVTNFGDQYFKRYFLQRIERTLAKHLGFDVFSLETSIASNYFNYLYQRQFKTDEMPQNWNYLTFANVGITVGRYFLSDKVLLKWRTELIPEEYVLTPEHSIGIEYQPFKYLWFDVNYGFYKNEDEALESDPRFRMQLRLPLGKMRNYFDF